MSVKTPKTLFFDLSTHKNRGRRPSDRMRLLDALKEGKSVVLDHSPFNTPFPVWIAQARMRLGKAFEYELAVPNTKLYRVWVPVPVVEEKA